jgi:hypothetical protein
MPVLGTDPAGREVVCDQEHWERHILARHPEMAGLEEELRHAISTPKWVIASGRRSAGRWEPCLVLFRPVGDQVLKVVIRPFKPAAAFVVTAYLVPADRHRDSHTLGVEG